MGLTLPWSGRERVETDPEDGHAIPRPVTPRRPVRPGFRGYHRPNGGWAGKLPQVDEFFGVSSQVSGGFWPFSTDMVLPVSGVPLGQLRGNGAAVCCDPISWFRDGIVSQPSMFVLGLPAIGKSTLVRRLVWGMSAMGVSAIIPGDLKGEYTELISLLNGQVISLGTHQGSVNLLDPGDVHSKLKLLNGPLRDDLMEDYHNRRLSGIEVIIGIMRQSTGGSLSDVESNVLSTALKVLYEKTRNDERPPVISDLRDLIADPPSSVKNELRSAATFEDPEDDEIYRKETHSLIASLNGLANPNGKFGGMFCQQTSDSIDVSRPVCYDIHSLAGAEDAVVAAVLATTWSSAFAAKNAADLLAEAGLEPKRVHVMVLDEMHRALRSSPLMVDKFDLLTRLNRQWGFGQIMITHTFADLLSMPTEDQNNKARGFVERSAIKILGALTSAEVDKYLRKESGLQIFQREEDLLSDWTTPVSYQSQAARKGRGKFLIKIGGLPGIAFNLHLCDLELSGFNDTNQKWHE